VGDGFGFNVCEGMPVIAVMPMVTNLVEEMFGVVLLIVVVVGVGVGVGTKRRAMAARD